MSPAQPRRPAAPPNRGGADRNGALVVIALAAALLGAAGVVGMTRLLDGGGWRPVRLAAVPDVIAALVTRGSRWQASLPENLRHHLPRARWRYALSAAIVLGGVAAGMLARARWQRRPRTPRAPELERDARWACREDLQSLVLRRPEPGRVVLGRVGRRLLAAEVGHSLLVVGPTQSGKTSSLAVPALLEWQGPVVATSVKTDLLHATHAWRAHIGTSFVFDPAAVANLPRSGWSPLAAAATWSGARRVAAALCSVCRTGKSAMEDAEFWYATAEKLLAPLLFAAAISGAAMDDVVRWVDTEEMDEVASILADVGNAAAVQAAAASFSREERQRSSVYATAETVLAAYADPVVAATARRCDIDPARLVGAGARDTCYLIAPAHEQERLQPVFVALLQAFLEATFAEAARRNRPLDPPLLIVLDEAANIAPLDNLDALAATAASHGVQVVTLVQDLAQLDARYGARAATVVNNHRAKLVCSGVADPFTLEQMSRLVGEEECWSDSTSVDAHGLRSWTTSATSRPLAPPDAIRRLPPGEAILLYAHLPPVRLVLRPFYRDRRLVRQAGLNRARGPRWRRHRPRRGWPRG